MTVLRNISLAPLVALSMAVAALIATLQVSHAAELIMLEQDGCHWCEIWDKEIGAVYDKTDESKQAPLRRVDIHEPLPDDLKGMKRANYTPTFVVWHNGHEIDRLRGYPGDHFFWPMLQQMLAKIDKTDAPDTTEPKS